MSADRPTFAVEIIKVLTIKKLRNMKKNVFMIMVLCCVSMMANAEVAKYCMSYADYVADNWKSVDELTEGCTNQVCQLKSDDHCVYFKTGDKACDEILKKQAFAVKYGNQLYVNSRNLRYNDIPLETSKYIQAVPYGDHKLCVMAYKTNTLLALADIGCLASSIFVSNNWVSLGLLGGSIGAGVANHALSDYTCYLIDSNANAKGKTPITRINDAFMENLLSDDASLLGKYMAVKNKHGRQSAANVLPILMEKGLVAGN